MYTATFSLNKYIVIKKRYFDFVSSCSFDIYEYKRHLFITIHCKKNLKRDKSNKGAKFIYEFEIKKYFEKSKSSFHYVRKDQMKFILLRVLLERDVIFTVYKITPSIALSGHSQEIVKYAIQFFGGFFLLNFE